MPETGTLIDKILAGQSIRVLLHPRHNVQINFPDMYEVFDLRNILLKDGKFFAKTSNCHAVPANFGAYDMAMAFSYAYSNHYSYVVNCSHTEITARIYNKNVYEDIEFKAIPNYELIWDSERGADTKPVENAITAGRRLKAALLDAEGFWNIHPVHMPSFYVGKNFFELFTDQDAFPAFLRNGQSLDELEARMKEQLKQMVRTHSPRNLREVFDKAGFTLTNPEFFSTFYTIRSNGQYLRASTVLKQEAPQHYRSLRVFADKAIGD